MILHRALAVSAALAFTLGGCQTTRTDSGAHPAPQHGRAMAALESVPLPSDATVTPPEPEVSQELAAFSGKWSGRWNGDKLPHVLLVQTIQPSGEARVIYAYSAYAPWNISQAAAFRHLGRIAGGKLRFILGNGAEVTYWLDGTDLKGEYLRDGQITLIRMKRT